MSSNPGAHHLLEVGRIGKAHGLKGEVLVRLVSDRTERVAPGAILSTPKGELTVVASRPHQDRWIVQFAGITGRTEAEAWHGTVLSGEPIDDPAALFVHDLVGCRVVDAGGVDRGTITAVQANPASDLLVLDGGALVPLTFVVGAIETGDDGAGVVHVDVPDGLFELYE
ncbi:MAG: ribosome maturation factor RimM [Acidimicrobiales bacterium]